MAIIPDFNSIEVSKLAYSIMGNKGSNQDNPNFNMEEYNNRLRQANIYSQTAVRQPVPTRHDSFRTTTNPVTVHQQQAQKAAAHFVFDKKDISVTQEGRNRLRVRFGFMAKQECQITLYVLAQQLEDSPTSLTVSIEGTYTVNQIQEPVEKGVFDKTIDLGKKTVTELGLEGQQTRGLFPIVVVFTSSTQKLYVYLRPMKGGLKDTQVLRQKYELEGRGYYTEVVYGINKSDEEKLCIICFTNPSTVIVYPCRHMCLCGDCLLDVRDKCDKCPICRGEVKEITEVKLNN